VLHMYRIFAMSITSQGMDKLVDGRTKVLMRHLTSAESAQTIELVKEKLSRYHLEAGYIYFTRSDIHEARKYLKSSLKFSWNIAAFLYLCMSYLGVRIVYLLKSLKNGKFWPR